MKAALLFLARKVTGRSSMPTHPGELARRVMFRPIGGTVSGATTGGAGDGNRDRVAGGSRILDQLGQVDYVVVEFRLEQATSRARWRTSWSHSSSGDGRLIDVLI